MESKVIKDKPTYSVITENEVTTEKNGMMTPVSYIEQYYPNSKRV